MLYNALCTLLTLTREKKNYNHKPQHQFSAVHHNRKEARSKKSEIV